MFDYSFCHLKNLFMIFIVSAEERNASLAEIWALFFILNEKDGLPVLSMNASRDRGWFPTLGESKSKFA